MAVVTGNPRIDLGTYLTEYFAATDVNVYNHPSEVVAIPYVAVLEQDTYYERDTFGQSSYTHGIFNMSIAYGVQRGELRSNFAEADQLRFSVMNAIETGTTAGRSLQLTSASAHGDVEHGTIQGLGGTVDLTMRAQPNP